MIVSFVLLLGAGVVASAAVRQELVRYAPFAVTGMALGGADAYASSGSAIYRLDFHSGPVLVYTVPPGETIGGLAGGVGDALLFWTAAGGVRQLSPSGVVTLLSPAPNDGSGGMTGAPDGATWFAPGHGLVRVAPTGQLRRFDVSGLRIGAIAHDRNGGIWAADADSNRVLHISPSGRILFTTRYEGGCCAAPRILPSRDGGVWILRVGDARIIRIDPRGVAHPPLVVPSDSPIDAVANGPDGLYFAGASIFRFRDGVWARVNLGQPRCGGFRRGAIVADPSGVVWAAELGRGRCRSDLLRVSYLAFDPVIVPTLPVFGLGCVAAALILVSLARLANRHACATTPRWTTSRRRGTSRSARESIIA